MNKAKLLKRTKGFKTYFDTLSSKSATSQKYYDSRTKYINGIYHVYPVAITDHQVFICCPLCHQFHSHGLAGGNYEGYRVKHCNSQNDENEVYNIEKL